MGSYSGGYHGLMARLDTERPALTLQEAILVVRDWLNRREGKAYAHFIDLYDLERALPVVLAALEKTTVPDLHTGGQNP